MVLHVRIVYAPDHCCSVVGPSSVAGASGVVTGMGEGWVVVFSKSEELPRSTKLTERDVAGTLFGYGEGGVVVAVVGSSNAGLSWVVKAV